MILVLLISIFLCIGVVIYLIIEKKESYYRLSQIGKDRAKFLTSLRNKHWQGIPGYDLRHKYTDSNYDRYSRRYNYLGQKHYV